MFDNIKTYTYLGLTCAYLSLDDGEDLSIEVFFRHTGAVDSLVFSKVQCLYLRWSYNTESQLGAI